MEFLADADFDGDGDIDYAALNAGYNTKYGHPTEQKPTVLYRDDMDGTASSTRRSQSAPEGELPVPRALVQQHRDAFHQEKVQHLQGFRRLQPLRHLH